MVCLVQNGVDVSKVDYTGNTALHKALQVLPSTCLPSAVEAYLNACAERDGHVDGINAKNAAGLTPLQCEIEKMRSCTPQVVRLLLRSGGNPNAPFPDGSSPAERAEKKRSLGSKHAAAALAALL